MSAGMPAIDIVVQQSEHEVAMFLEQSGEILRNANVSEHGNETSIGEANSRSTLPDIDAIETLSRCGISLLWRMLEAVFVAVTKVMKRYSKVGKNIKGFKNQKSKIMTFLAINILFFTRSQKINGFQTMIEVLLSACHTIKVTMKIIYVIGFWELYIYCIGRMKQIENDKKAALRDWVKNRGGKIYLNNVNCKIVVSDEPGTWEALMDNSTGGFISPIVGFPAGMRMMPRNWMHGMKRMQLELRDLSPVAKSYSMICRW